MFCGPCLQTGRGRVRVQVPEQEQEQMQMQMQMLGYDVWMMRVQA